MEETKIFTKKDIVALIAALERDLAALSGTDFLAPSRRKGVIAIVHKYCGPTDAARLKQQLENVDYDLTHGEQQEREPGDVRRIAGYINKARGIIVQQIDGNERFLKSIK